MERLFPAQIDNKFRGHWLGLIIFILVIIAKGGQAIQGIIHTRHVATGPDAIDLAGIGNSQVNDILSLFATIGLYALILPVLGLAVLARWRAMIPFMYLCFILFYLATRLLHLLHPSFANERTTYGAYVNLGILAVMVVGLLLSLWGRKEQPAREPRQPAT